MSEVDTIEALAADVRETADLMKEVYVLVSEKSGKIGPPPLMMESVANMVAEPTHP